MNQESCLSYSALPSQTNDYDEAFLEELHEGDELYYIFVNYVNKLKQSLSDFKMIKKSNLIPTFLIPKSPDD